jgi:curved DNA-binding protein CbpA
MDGKSNIDPYKVLNVPRNFTMEQLKDAYKSMALKVHPDKGGSEYLFKLVTACYRALSKEYQKRASDKQYHELKHEFTKHQSQQQPQNIRIDPAVASKGFNIEKFNRIFEENKTGTIDDVGYGDFLKNTPARDEPKNMFSGKKFSQDTFNRLFEKEASKDKEQSKFLVKYRDPEPLMASKKISYTELGADSVDDFSANNISKKSLNYMDLKIAHTTSRIVDPRTVDPRKEYRSVEDFEADRSKVSYTLNDEDREYYDRKKQVEERRERQRQHNVTRSDQEAALQFERLHKVMLGR